MQSLSTPTIATLYLAFRQAKTALFFERRGVGLLELAKFEQDLPTNLRLLQSKIADRSWFDNIDIGEIWVVPKRSRSSSDMDAADDVVRIGTPMSHSGPRSIDIQLRLSPSPEFAILEVLYLWQFGVYLEALLSKRDVLGYRLDIRGGKIEPTRRWLFEYWPPKYQQFRTSPLEGARRALITGDEALIISGDLASFYDTIDPKFMLEQDFVQRLHGVIDRNFNWDEYRRATSSLIEAYRRYHTRASSRASIRINIGVPIGALTSRLIANLALISLDEHISQRPGVICYRRYVDDIVIVAKSTRNTTIQTEILREFLPIKEPSDDVLYLNVSTLRREGSEFQLQQKKIRIHHLAGVPGTDFVEAVKSDFQKTVSERRAFVDSATLLGDGVTHLVRAGEAEGSPLRVLRDADRARLERFALSTSLDSLERVSSLVDHGQAKELVRRSLERVGRVLASEGNWIDDLSMSLRLLKLAISTGDWNSASELNEQMDKVWGSIETLRSNVAALYYRDNKIESNNSSVWVWLRNYLHERRIEAIASSFPIGQLAGQAETRLSRGIRYKTLFLGATALRRRAERLAYSDLRSRDREEDSQPSTLVQNLDYEWLWDELGEDPALRNRMVTIGDFIKACEHLNDRSWLLPPARLFLCTRPPSYFDIARRWLHQVETKGFAQNIFEKLLDLVNAVRGTKYRNPIGTVINPSTVVIGPPMSDDINPGPLDFVDPRLILGNLVINDVEWQGAATRVSGSPFGAPVLSLKRLLRVARVLDRSTRLAKGCKSVLLVLPELSLPRQWFRAVANHVVTKERFGLVVGLEYRHHKTSPYVYNQVFTVLPGPFLSAATWSWTKRLPAREEHDQLSKLSVPVGFAPYRPTVTPIPRTVVHSPMGQFSVLICSELLEARRVADLLGRVNLVLCPAWNKDTSSYDHLVQSVGFQLHSIIAIANNGHYSDCRAWAPHVKRWKRDLCRLIERDDDDVVHVDLPLTSLNAVRSGRADEDWRPLPPDWP